MKVVSNYFLLAPWSFESIANDRYSGKTVRLFLSFKAVVSSKPVNKPSSISSKTVVFSDNLSSIVVVSRCSGLRYSSHFLYWPNSLNSCLQLQNFGCQGLRIAFSNTSMSLKLALRLVSKSTNNVFYTASVLNKISEIHVYSFKVLDARAQDCIFQHLLGPEACPGGAIKKYP